MCARRALPSARRCVRAVIFLQFYMVNEAVRSMSGDETCEETDWMHDTHGIDSSHLLSVKVEYYRSFEFSLRWTPMSFRRSSRLKSILKTPVLDEDVEQPRRRSLRGRSRLKETDAIKSNNCDIIDLINRNRDLDHTAKLGEAVGVLDFGLDQSNDEDGSESCSIVSGPSTLCQDNKEELCHNLCSACQELYKKAKSLKTPILSKLLDNDPQSLTCDQWVLMKKWKPKRLPDARQKFLSHLRLDSGVSMWREDQSSPCLRAHTFLQRNLRRAKRLAEMNKKKRRRGKSQNFRVAKQQRLQNNHHRQHTNTKGSVNSPSCFSSCSNLQDGSSPEVESRAAKDVTVQLIPSPVAPKFATSAEVRAQERAPKKMSEFRDLLAQLRGTSSMITREAHYQKH
ncbi:uncharacterized protein si:ch211-227n13.3 isoform X1 [Girardinichthys multiradiatus]|uniref:uncharacterized protein si:ch211-227n13.3 isoform X1 n=2 Tax=Girardinichthys multiradiatus TaxID=208333 RepID=UPI001FAD8725|nr:uncharacterized protein si:ch211-227n13.3 isoform X1 [Girardinichthys multiradiatus]